MFSASVHLYPLSFVSGRFSFEAACQRYLVNLFVSELYWELIRASVSKEQIDKALRSDLLAAQNLFSKLAEDLTRLTGQTVTSQRWRYHYQRLILGGYASFAGSIKERLVFVEELLRKHFQTAVAELLNVLAHHEEYISHHVATENVGRVTFHQAKFFPLAPFTGLGLGQMAFRFTMAQATGECLYHVCMTALSYHDPLRWNHPLPISLKNLLNRLGSTHFDYAPMLFSGVLCDKHAVGITKEEKQNCDFGQGLLIHLGKSFPAFVIDYREGKPSVASPPIPCLPLQHRLLPFFAVLLSFLHVLCWQTFPVFFAIFFSLGLLYLSMRIMQQGLVFLETYRRDSQEYYVYHSVPRCGIRI